MRIVYIYIIHTHIYTHTHTHCAVCYYANANILQYVPPLCQPSIDPPPPPCRFVQAAAFVLCGLSVCSRIGGPGGGDDDDDDDGVSSYTNGTRLKLISLFFPSLNDSTRCTLSSTYGSIFFFFLRSSMVIRKLM